MADMKPALLVMLVMVMVTPITPQCDSSRPSAVSWHNDWHQSFYAYCNSGRELSQWISYYRQCQGDRLYHLRCSVGPASGYWYQYCAWTDYVNAAGQYHFTGCTNNGYVTGIISAYDSSLSDRRIRFRCCRIWGYKSGVGYRQYLKTNCQITAYQNSFGATLLNYNVPNGYTLTGVGSYYNSYYKDRRFRFQICQMQN